jgi:tetratricopeptide (TPR) repeat protein
MPKNNKKARVDILIDATIDKLENDHLTEALMDCNKAIELDPGVEISHNLQGVIYARLGHYDESIESFKSAIRLSSDYYEARENLRNARIEKEKETYIQIAKGNMKFPLGFDIEEKIYGESELPGYYYLGLTSYICRGYPGFRNLPGKSGYDPMDTYMEQGYMGGLLLKKLFSLSLPLGNPIYFLLGIIISLFMISPLLLSFILILQGQVFVDYSYLPCLIPYAVIGSVLLINVIKNINK